MPIKRRPRWWPGLAVALVLVAAVLLASCKPNLAPRVGSVAPDFTLPTLDGGTVRLSQLRGKPVFLNFWTTWCLACREEMPHIQAASLEQEGQGFTVVAVDLQESASTVGRFIQSNGYTFTVALDGDGRVGNLYAVVPLPTTFIIDSQGVIRRIQVGAYRNKDQILAHLQAVK